MPDIQTIADKVEKEFQCSGLSDGLYYAKEITGQYILKCGKQAITDADIRHVDIIAITFVNLLEEIDSKKAKELCFVWCNKVTKLSFVWCDEVTDEVTKVDANEEILSDFFDRYIVPLEKQRDMMYEKSEEMWYQRIDDDTMKLETEKEKLLTEKIMTLQSKINELYEKWWNLHDKYPI